MGRRDRDREDPTPIPTDPLSREALSREEMRRYVMDTMMPLVARVENCETVINDRLLKAIASRDNPDRAEIPRLDAEIARLKRELSSAVESIARTERWLESRIGALRTSDPDNGPAMVAREALELALGVLRGA